MLIEDKIKAPVGDVEKKEDHWKHDATPFVDALSDATASEVSEGTGPVKGTAGDVDGLQNELNTRNSQFLCVSTQKIQTPALRQTSVIKKRILGKKPNSRRDACLLPAGGVETTTLSIVSFSFDPLPQSTFKDVMSFRFENLIK